MGATYKFCRAAFPFFRIFHKRVYARLSDGGAPWARAERSTTHFLCIHSEFGRPSSENVEVAWAADEPRSLQARSGVIID